LVCNECVFDFHSQCKIERILPFKIVRRSFKQLEVLVNELEEKLIMYDLENLYPNIKSQRKSILDEYKKLANNLTEAESTNNQKFNFSFHQSILKLKSKIEKSDLINSIGQYEFSSKVRKTIKYLLANLIDTAKTTLPTAKSKPLFRSSLIV
jgi:2-oxoglutarate dehydrogenase complex dehydrogenase (E1) component-like enzyme